MKNRIGIVSFAVLSVAAFGMAACTEPEPDPTPTLEPEFSVEESISVPASGGECSFTYEVQNPVEGAGVNALPEKEWVEVVSCGNGTVVLNVEENTEYVSRESSVYLSYEWDGGSLSDTLSLVQEAAEEPVFEGTDLGECANTYIVPEAGDYSFTVGKVTGGSIEGIEAVDWLWATKPQSGDTQDILTDISYSDGKVYFTATGNKGDVVLAATDAEGNIVWSWLIWATEQPATMVYENGAEFMDRNIGATSAEAGSDGAFGVMYQWGRKDPIYGGTINEAGSGGEIAFSTAQAQTIVNESFGMTWQFVSNVATAEMAIAQPMSVFYDAENQSGNWINNHEDASWTDAKTDHDPCPAGYRVPSSEEFSDIVNGEITSQGLTYTYNGQSAWYPVQGLREDLTGVLVITNCLFMWTNTELVRESLYDPNLLFYLSLRVFATEESGMGPLIQNNAQSNRGMVIPVRCVKE